MHNDKTPALTKGLQAFCERARSLIPPLPVLVVYFSESKRAFHLTAA